MIPVNYLMAYPYFSDGVYNFLKAMPRERFRLIVDSGAFTAWNTGKEIKLDEYCSFLDKIQSLRPFHAVQLDVFGDPEKSYKNFLIMKSRGYDVMPVFTRGESLERLEEYYSHTDYIMFGGIVIGGANENYVKWFLNRNKGRKCHWLGFVNVPFIKTFKPESVDSSSWGGTARFGNLQLYSGFGKIKTYSKDDFKTKPTAEIIQSFRRVGLDESHAKFMGYDKVWASPWNYRNKKVWTQPECGMAQFVSTISHLVRSYEIEKTLGTKVYLAGNNERITAHLFMALDYLIEAGKWK